MAKKGKRGSRDLTQGNIAQELILFSLPIFAGQIFQNLYNSVDAIVVGRAIGTTALAAVSSSADISMLLTGFFVGFSTGGGVLVSRYFGAKEPKNLEKALHTLVSFGVIIGLTMAVLGIILSPALLRLVKCPDDVFPEALAYLRVYLVGVLFTSIYNVGSRILQAVGDSKRPFYYLVIASVTNIVMDVLFVLVLKLGVIGAALATIISQSLSVVLVYTRMLRTDDVYHLRPKKLLQMDGHMLREIAMLGFPAAIQASLISISNLFVQRYVNSFGSSAMAGIGAAKKIDRFVGMIAQSLGLATTTFVSQNVGAKKYDRAFHGIRTALVICGVYLLTVGTAVFVLAEFFVNIFISEEAAVAFGVDMVHWMLPFYFFQVLNSIFANAVRGFGKSMVVMVCSVAGMIGCRQLFLIIAMKLNYSVTNVYIAFPFGWACAALLVMVYYFVKIRPKYSAELKKDD
ncbi:MAG: MATE family efflux transporter [Lachnospiraceae bacterium]|nr:MATE family efflux transporter [Lachnospiraceae bacterium]